MAATKASGDSDMEYRGMMAKIATRIDDESLDELKYQCKDIIGDGKLEMIANPQGLFQVLEERDEVSSDNLTFLCEILKNIGRIDLYKVVKSHQDSVMQQNNSPLDSQINSISPDSSTSNMTDFNQSSLPSKVFSQDGKFGPQKAKFSHTTYTGVTEGQNCSTPFDTFGEQHHAPVYRNEHSGRNQQYHMAPHPAISPDVRNALEMVLGSISRGWESAARHLGVPDVIVDSAQDNWPRNVRNQIRETFEYWARTDTHASVPKLIQAMRKIGRNDIADDLQYG